MPQPNGRTFASGNQSGPLAGRAQQRPRGRGRGPRKGMDHRREENVLFFRFLAGDTAALQELKTLLWDTAEHTIARMLQLTSDLAKRLMHSTWRYAERHGHSRYDPRYGFLDWFIRMACFIHNHSGMIDNQPGESRMVDSGQTAVA